MNHDLLEWFPENQTLEYSPPCLYAIEILQQIAALALPVGFRKMLRLRSLYEWLCRLHPVEFAAYAIDFKYLPGAYLREIKDVQAACVQVLFQAGAGAFGQIVTRQCHQSRFFIPQCRAHQRVDNTSAKLAHIGLSIWQDDVINENGSGTDDARCHR